MKIVMGCDGLRVELMTKLGSSADRELPHWLQMYPVRAGLHPSAEKRQFRLNCLNTLSPSATSWPPCCHLNDITHTPTLIHTDTHTRARTHTHHTHHIHTLTHFHFGVQALGPLPWPALPPASPTDSSLARSHCPPG